MSIRVSLALFNSNSKKFMTPTTFKAVTSPLPHLMHSTKEVNFTWIFFYEVFPW